MTALALLTGRGNNTLKNKNILPVNGLPVLAYPAIAARNSQYCSQFYASSDSDEILEISSEYGFNPIKRPETISRSDSLHYDAIVHSLDQIVLLHKLPPIVVVLLANSVTIKSSWIDSCIEILIRDHSCSAVVPVVADNDHHPYRCKRLSGDGFLEAFIEQSSSVSSNRQDLPTAFFLAHNFWTIRTDVLLNVDLHGEAPWPFMGQSVCPFKVSTAFDIHSHEDLIRSQQWVLNNRD